MNRENETMITTSVQGSAQDMARAILQREAKFDQCHECLLNVMANLFGEEKGDRYQKEIIKKIDQGEAPEEVVTAIVLGKRTRRRISRKRGVK